MESDFIDFIQDGQLSRQSGRLKICASMVRFHYHPLCSHLLKGLGQHPFKVQMRVRFPLGVLPETALVNVTQYVPYNKSNGKALPLLDMQMQCNWQHASLPSLNCGIVVRHLLYIPIQFSWQNGWLLTSMSQVRALQWELSNFYDTGTHKS